MSYLEENHTEGEEPTLPKTRSKSRSKKNLIAALVLVLLAFFGFGVTVTAVTIVVYQVMLRKFRQRPRVIFCMVLPLVAVFGIWSMNLVPEAWDTFIRTFWSNPATAWGDLNKTLVVPGIAMGGIVGWLFALDTSIKFTKSPWMVNDPEMWSYKFKFANSPVTYFKNKSLIRRIKNGSFFTAPTSEVMLGVDEETGKPVMRTYAEANKHTLVTGAPGTGKSILLMFMVLFDTINKVPAIFIDFKSTKELAEHLAKWAHENGRKFYHFEHGTDEKYNIQNNPAGHAYFDPLYGLGITEKADMILNMRSYDVASEVYKNAAREILMVVLQALENMNPDRAKGITTDEGEIRKIYDALDNMIILENACEGTEIYQSVKRINEESKTRSSIKGHALENLKSDLNTILISEFGQWIKKPKDPSERFIDLFELTRDEENPPVVLFGLNSDSEREFAKYFGSLIMGNITALSAQRREDAMENQVSLYVDEFQVLPPETIRGLVEKARASNIAITLSQQSIQQVVTSADRNGEAALDSLLDTLGNFVIFSGSSQTTAETLSRLVGTQEAVEYYNTKEGHRIWFSINWDDRRNSRITQKVVEKPVIAPQEFMNLESPAPYNNWRSTAVVIKKSGENRQKGKPAAQVNRVQVVVPQDVLDKYHTSKEPVGVQKPWLEKTGTAPVPTVEPLDSFEGSANAEPVSSPTVPMNNEHDTQKSPVVSPIQVKRRSLLDMSKTAPQTQVKEVQEQVFFETDGDNRLGEAVSKLYAQFDGPHKKKTPPSSESPKTPRRAPKKSVKRSGSISDIWSQNNLGPRKEQ